MTRAEMYRKVRDSLSDCYVDALDALAALEAGEREAPLDPDADGECPNCANPPHEGECKRRRTEASTPPASPATEAIADAFARDFFVRHDHTYSGIEIYEWLKNQVAGPVAPPAAECAAPREGQIVFVQGGVAQYRDSKFYSGMEDPRYGRPIKWDVQWWHPIDKGPALAAPCECQRLREELEERRAQLSALAEVRDLQIGRLDAELRQAMDAMRPFEEYYRKRDRYPTDPEYAIVAGFVAAYDAKHREKS